MGLGEPVRGSALSVAVVVPTLGRPSLERTLAGLRSQTRAPDEVVVVRDDDRRGPGWARNEGIRRSSADLIAFIDDDLVAPAEWLERLVSAVEAHGAAGAGGTYVEKDPLLSALRRRRPMPTAEMIDPGGLVGIGGNVLFRRSWLERIADPEGRVYEEWLDPHGGEDWDLVLRLRVAGARLVWVPIALEHHRRAGFASHLRQQLGRGIGVGKLHQLHRRSPLPAQRSLLWGSPERRRTPRWLAAAARKIIGPRPASDLSASQFLTYWAGEKALALGFVWALVAHRIPDGVAAAADRFWRENAGASPEPKAAG